MELFSFSRLEIFDTCKRRFAYKYIEELEDPPGPLAILGKTVHKAYQLCMNGHSLKDAIAIAHLLEADGNPTVDLTTVEKMVKTALSYGYSGIVEHHFKIHLTKNIMLQGYIDLLPDNTSIPTLVDFKTGFKVYGVFDTWQLPLYAAAVMEKTGYKNIKGVYKFLRFNRTEEGLITQEKALQAKQWAIQTAREIKARLDLLAVLDIPEAFPPSPSPACGDCRWSLSCLKESKNIMIL